jgi:hypothetical protein
MTRPHHSRGPGQWASTRYPAGSLSPCATALNNAGDAQHPRCLQLVSEGDEGLDELIRQATRAGRHGTRPRASTLPRLPTGFRHVALVQAEDLVARVRVRRRDVAEPSDHTLTMRPAQDALGLALLSAEPLAYLSVPDEPARTYIDVRVPKQDCQGAAISLAVVRQAHGCRDPVLGPAEELADIYQIGCLHKRRSVS